MTDLPFRKVNITIVGLVQGVGFRPYVARLAQKWRVHGEVRNDGGAVNINAAAPPASLDAFINDLTRDPPENSEIIHMSVEENGLFEQETGNEPEGFRIVESVEGRKDIIILPPDLPVCDTCLAEMHDPNDRRHLHPFISCTNCGPRYSIINSAPYDRQNTSMDIFPLCESCGQEYEEKDNRRLHAQTVSCHDCGPALLLLSETGLVKGHETLDKAVSLLKDEGILAVKGIGGYHFICNPSSDRAVLDLRRMKAREQKPFAVCYPDMIAVKRHHEVSAREEELLRSKARPIVLLERKDFLCGDNLHEDPEHGHSCAISRYVSQNSRYTGAFLPYTPVLHMITEQFGPVVATSANITDSPIIFRDRDIREFKSPYLKGILTHGREIVTNQDDSVAWVVNGEAQVLRRSRGYVPLPVHISSLGAADMDTTVFAAGGHLKSTFCFQKGHYAFLSQYLGDLGSLESYDAYRENVAHMKDLLRLEPVLAVCDLHPDYQSTDFVRESGMEYIGVQHHHAHTAAVMAEHGLTDPVIGVSFDGTGYGTDGAVWGGEFLICNEENFTRAGHLKYMPILAGDESMRDVAKTAICFLEGLELGGIIADERYPVIKAALKKGFGVIPTSSMGRLFDAVSAILGLCSYSRYEGEAAILLENAASSILRNGSFPYEMNFDIIKRDGTFVLDSGRMLNTLVEAHQKGESAASLALGFHRAVVNAVIGVCGGLREEYSIGIVALSGGVFQNRILAEEITYGLLREGFRVYSGREIPPNDSGISLGQAYIGMKTLMRRKEKEV